MASFLLLRDVVLHMFMSIRTEDHTDGKKTHAHNNCPCPCGSFVLGRKLFVEEVVEVVVCDQRDAFIPELLLGAGDRDVETELLRASQQDVVDVERKQRRGQVRRVRGALSNRWGLHRDFCTGRCRRSVLWLTRSPSLCSGFQVGFDNGLTG